MPRERAGRLALGLALLVAAQTAAGWMWAARDEFPAGYETCEHLIFARTIAYEYRLARADASPLALVDWAQANRRIWTRATLVHLAMAPAAEAWDGDDAWLLAAIVGGTSLIVIALSTYALAWRLGVDAQPASPRAASFAGALGVALVVFAPGCWGTARRFGVDLPLAAAVAAHAALLVCHPPWRQVSATALQGLLAGVLCLVKAQFVFWSPGLVVASLVSARLGTRVACGRFALFAAAAALGSLPFWAGDLVEVLRVFGWHATALDNPSNDLPEQWTARSFLYYPLATCSGLGYAAMPLVGAGLWRGRRTATTQARTVLIGLAFALVVHTAIALKFARYFLPAIPLVAALGAAGALALGPRLRRGLVTVAVGGGLALELASSTGSVGTWTGIDPESVHAPVPANWQAETEAIAQGANAAPFETPYRIGLEGPEGWDPDDFSRLEWMLRAQYPAAVYVRRSALRSVEDLTRFERALPELTMRIVVRDLGLDEVPPEPPPGWRRVYDGQLSPALRPIPGEPVGPPLRIEAWLPQSDVPLPPR